jgi:tetratricopeptide (TPR) repeat protein
MTETTSNKVISAGGKITIDAAAGLPLRKFLKAFKDRDYATAIKLERSLSDKDLQRPNVLFRLGVIYLKRGNIVKAQKMFERALEFDPAHAGSIQNLGTICLEKMDYVKGEEMFRKSLEIEPNNANAYNNLGACCSYQGKAAEAKEFYLKALELQPSRHQTFRNMSHHHKFESYDEILVSLLIAMSDETISQDDRSHLCFAAFKAFDDLGERKRAFEYLAKGNRLFRSVIDYSPQSDIDNLTVVKRAFRPKDMPSISKCIQENPLPHTPIFIIGMPRSGTSLTEQVISSHSKVHGGGELPILNQISNPLLGEIYGKATDQKIQTKHLERFRKQYIKACQLYPHDRAYMTDKMPANFRWVGFIKEALPEAKIINQVRDPRAICWSIFKLRFSTVGNGYAYDQVDLANYYHRYKDLMAYWEAKYPNQIHNLHYEDFTVNQEQGTRDLLKFIGLDWEDDCLNFHKSKRPVKTASSAQVKKELYTGSSEAWRKYEEFLGPMLEALGPLP